MIYGLVADCDKRIMITIGKNHYGNEKKERDKKDTLENLTIQKLRTEVEKLVNELSDYPASKPCGAFGLPSLL